MKGFDMASLVNALFSCRHLLPERFSQEHDRLFCEQHLLRLAQNLERFYREGAPGEFPPPHLDVECTPSLQEAFASFLPFLDFWAKEGDSPESLKMLAETIERSTTKYILVLLGQRVTPGSLTDARAIPLPAERLLASALEVYSDKLTAGARALTKHVNRNSGEFWGEVKGSQEEKNEKARRIILHILDHATWWNVFEHYKHGIVFEARVSSGHGVRWGKDGQELIGFLEPFTPGFPNIREES